MSTWWWATAGSPRSSPRGRRPCPPAPRCFGAAVTRRAYELAVPILAGTDAIASDSAGALPNLHRELEVLVAHAGLTPLAAIVAATGTAARALGIDDTTGTIAPGKVANLVVLDANPLADIRNTRRIVWVMKNGEVVARTH